MQSDLGSILYVELSHDFAHMHLDCALFHAELLGDDFIGLTFRHGMGYSQFARREDEVTLYSTEMRHTLLPLLEATRGDVRSTCADQP